jgi:radical SAM-linked protein
VRKTGFTLVPEAGTERLRCVINKNLKDEILWDAASNAFSLGWRLLKLYFMVGLPTEKDEDLEGIVCVVEEMLRLGKNILKHPPQINLSVSSFIPKPHTPFQWLKMENKQTLKDKHAMIRSRLKKYRSVRFKTHSVDLSVLEGIFSRGDRRLNPVLIRAWQSGARLDSWIDCFDFQLWQKAFDTEKLDSTMYLDKLPRDAVLPWDHVETGIKKVYLRQELDRALAGQPTKSCLEKDCRMCQGCTLWPLYEKEFSAEVSPSPVTSRRLGKKTDDTIRYRAVYDKQQMARFLSHNDLSRIIQRGFRRAGLSVQFSGGFHPKMNFSFLPALPLGMAGKEEVLEFKSVYEFLEKDLLSRLNDSLPEGILFSHLEKIETSRPSLNDDIQTMVYSIKLDSEQLKRLANHLVKTETDKNNALFDSLVEKLMEAAETFRPGVLEKIRFSEKQKRFFLYVRFDKVKAPRPQDIAEKIFRIENPVYLMTREKVIFKRQLTNKKP